MKYSYENTHFKYNNFVILAPKNLSIEKTPIFFSFVYVSLLKKFYSFFFFFFEFTRYTKTIIFLLSHTRMVLFFTYFSALIQASQIILHLGTLNKPQSKPKTCLSSCNQPNQNSTIFSPGFTLD